MIKISGDILTSLEQLIVNIETELHNTTVDGSVLSLSADCIDYIEKIRMFAFMELDPELLDYVSWNIKALQLKLSSALMISDYVLGSKMSSQMIQNISIIDQFYKSHCEVELSQCQ